MTCMCCCQLGDNHDYATTASTITIIITIIITTTMTTDTTTEVRIIEIALRLLWPSP